MSRKPCMKLCGAVRDLHHRCQLWRLCTHQCLVLRGPCSRLRVLLRSGSVLCGPGQLSVNSRRWPLTPSCKTSSLLLLRLRLHRTMEVRMVVKVLLPDLSDSQRAPELFVRSWPPIHHLLHLSLLALFQQVLSPAPCATRSFGTELLDS